PLNQQCPQKYRGPSDPFDTVDGISGHASNEGFRKRTIGTGETLNGAGTPAVGGILNTPDSIAYAFFSFGNVSKLAKSKDFGYPMLDGVDPLFATYNNAGSATPGQPANPADPTTWGELPACTPGGSVSLPDCTALAIWGGANNSYPHLRDGSYPAWSELRLICDSADASCSTDPFGAQKLVSNLQADIHFSHFGGVPDLLPFSNSNVAPLTFNPPYGDVSFVRQHFNAFEPNDNALAAKTAPW